MSEVVRQKIIRSLLPSAVVPVVLAILFNFYFQQTSWEHVPFHSLLEGAGTLVALVLALFILRLRHNQQIENHHLWTATALMSMGLLDGFHAASYPGEYFVWLHSLANFVGGVFFAMVLLPDRFIRFQRINTLPFAVAMLCIIVAVITIVNHELVPQMLSQGKFTPIALILNLAGGVGFILAWVSFVFSPSKEHHEEKLYLSNHTLLFGTSALLFQFSVLWDSTWWLWHVLRLFAYLVVLWYFMMLFFRLMLASKLNAIRFRSLVETSSDWIWEIDTEDRFTYVSPKIKELLGYEPEEIIGQSAFELMAPEEAQQVNDVYIKLIENHQPFNGMINVNLHKDGHEVILESSGVPLFDEHGVWRGYRGIDRDITERLQQHNEAIKNQYRLNEAQSMAKIGSWELDLVTNYLWWSDQNFRIFGFEPGKFGASYEAFLDAIHPDDRDKVNEAYTSSLETKQPYSITHRLLFKDGSIKYVNERCETIYDQKGQAILSKGTTQDVTEQVLAEHALKESESRFHTLARLSPVGIFQTDTEGKCNYVNETWLTFAGMEYNQAMGLGWSDALHPEDKQAVFERWNISVQENKPFSMEYRFLRHDGTSIWVYGQADAHRDESNRVINYVGTITNINERKKSELEHFEAQRRMRKQQRATLVFAQKQKHAEDNLNLVYRQINETIASQLNIARVSIWFLNEAHNVLRCEDLFSTPKNQHETGMTLSIQDYPGYFNAMLTNQVISADDANSHKDTHEFSDDYLKPNGISSMLDAPLRDGSGNVIGVLCLEHVGEPRHWYPDEENFISSIADMLSLSIELHARKLTEVKLKIYQDHLEQMVEQRTHELEESNQELESFTYSVSHDLRTPLRGIDGFSRLLLDKYGNELDETGKDYLRRVRNGAQRMGLLISDMLQLSRANKQEIALETCNLSQIAEQSINELKQAEPECQIEIQITPDLEVESDPKMMSIVLDNLLGNAWKFSNKKDHACIEFGMLDDADESIYFVRDNGAGFDMQYADKLFQVFQRLHSADEYPGTGVGLSTVARLIKRLGGRIWAESELGKGATFYFTPINNEK